MPIGLVIYLGCSSIKNLDSASPPIDQDQQPELSLNELIEGDIIVTEIMINPEECDDSVSEYVEIYNSTNRWININGLIIKDSTNEFHLDQELLASPNSLILARLQSAEDCFELEGDFIYDLQWNNTGDIIELRNESVLLDSVDFSSWQIPAGASLSLDASQFNVTANDLESNWCPSSEAIANEHEDFGTPGRSNPDCQDR